MKLVLAALAVTAAVTGTAAVVVTRAPTLEATGEVSVAGTRSAAFTIGSRPVRQVRYVDRAVLRYAFSLHNPGRVGLEVTGLAQPEHEATLLKLVSLTHDGSSSFGIGAGDTTEVVLEVQMTDCEHLSARASSLIGTIPLEVSSIGIDHDVVVALPEALRTGSAREMNCPRATATSRPPG